MSGSVKMLDNDENLMTATQIKSVTTLTTIPCNDSLAHKSMCDQNAVKAANKL